MASMGTRLIITLFLFTLLPTILFGALGYYFVHSDLEDQIKNTFRTESEGLGTSMRLLYDLRMQQISALTLDENIQNHLLEYYDNPDISTISYSNFHDKITRTFTQFGETTGGHYNKIFTDIVGFYDYHVVANDGKVLYDSDTSTLENILSDYLVFSSQLIKPNVSYQFDKLTNSRAMVVSSPIPNIYGGSPQTLGVLIASMGVKTSDHILIDFRNRNTDENYLVDMNKMMISESRFIDDAPFNIQVDTVAVRECIEHDKNHIGFYSDYRGVPIFGSSYCAKELGFVLLREIDAKELFLPLEELMYEIIFIGAGLGVMAIIAGVRVSKTITNPLNKLDKAIHRIVGGKYDTLIKKNGFKEIDDLTESFNIMTKTIKDDKIQIDTQIKKITLAENKIAQQFDELKLIDKQKGEFSAMISHELKTPLVPIMGYCEMLNDEELLGKLTPKQKSAIEKIYDESKRLEVLIQKILDAEKLDLKKMNWKKEEFYSDEFMQHIFSGHSSLMTNKKIEFRNTSTEHLKIFSDKNKLLQVFTNVIQNAVDFVTESSGKIEINASQKDDYVVFYVKDNGIGMSKSEQMGLFKKFYQVDTSIIRKHGGSGLGLAICKGIVEGLNGKIWIMSEKGQGTTLYFKIPKTSPSD